MRVIKNLPSLQGLDDQPIMFGDPPEPYTIASWVMVALNTIPGRLLDSIGALHFTNVMRACVKANAGGEVVKDDIVLQADEYKWLMETMFNDNIGVEMSRMLVGKEGTPNKGAWLLAALRPIQAVVLLKEHLEMPEPAKLRAVNEA